MKKLYCLFAIFLICGFSGMAKADDFHMVVLDPPPPSGYTVYPIDNLLTFSPIFTSCVSPGQTPAGSGYDGCFTFQNETGTVLNGLDITVTALIPGQTAGCALSGLTDSSGPLDIFSNPTCSTGTSSYTLDFSGTSTGPGGESGLIALGQIITIAESGVAPGDFPDTEVTPTAVVGTTAVPEPSSLMLLSTGTVALGSFINKRRRKTDTTDRS